MYVFPVVKNHASEVCRQQQQNCCLPCTFYFNINDELFSSRSIRSRPGSLKAKNQYQKLRENGNVGAMTAEHKMDDFDIKILQQKRHEAEVKRYL